MNLPGANVSACESYHGNHALYSDDGMTWQKGADIFNDGTWLGDECQIAKVPPPTSAAADKLSWPARMLLMNTRRDDNRDRFSGQARGIAYSIAGGEHWGNA